MWLMTTKDRPAACQDTLDACWRTGMRQPGIVFVDGPGHAQYDAVRLPPNWTLVKWANVGGTGNLAGSMQYVFTTYPSERAYGWLADDNVPETPGWSDKVEEIAHPWRLAHCRDMFVSEMCMKAVRQLRQTRNLGGGICWGGELVRCVGWWAPPGVIQGAIDWAWTSLVGGTRLGVYVDDVVVRHDNWRTGRREQDENDDLGKPHILADVAHIKAYRETEDFKRLRERLMTRYEQYTGRP